MAESIYKLQQAHERVINNDKYVRSAHGQELNNGRVLSVHMDDFYTIQKWIKRLEEAKDSKSDELYSEVNLLIHEMRNRSNEYSALDNATREELMKLAKLPESMMSKYYNK